MIYKLYYQTLNNDYITLVSKIVNNESSESNDCCNLFNCGYDTGYINGYGSGRGSGFGYGHGYGYGNGNGNGSGNGKAA